MNNSTPYKIIADLEQELREYTGAPYAVALDSGTAALMLSVQWHARGWPAKAGIEIPRRTYVSVPCAIIHAGGYPVWRDERWRGAYMLHPLPVWDCARRFTGGMYVAGQFQCLSFATSKILGVEQGGAILHDSREADVWFRKMRFDGRSDGVDPRDDTFDLVGHHCIMPPSTAAELILKLYHLPEINEDLPYFQYPDLSLHPAFK